MIFRLCLLYNQLMKEWSEVRDQLSDSDDSERLTIEYQQRYSALQTQADSLSLQLDAVHQQHVQSAFSNKKKAAMSRLMQQLQDSHYTDVSSFCPASAACKILVASHPPPPHFSPGCVNHSQDICY